MIEIKNITTGEQVGFTITTFPDNTSQVWKLNPFPKKMDKLEVTWRFENEGELSHILQLGYLITEYCVHEPSLFMPFLPYGRQDKPVSNIATFALEPIVDALLKLYELWTIDIHSNHFWIKNKNVEDFHAYTLGLVCDPAAPDLQTVIFPDAGSFTRYKHFNPFGSFKFALISKSRNQDTGDIEGIEISEGKENIQGRNCLIVDDICDGGATFIEIAKLLKQFNPASIDLAVTHGLFSKGREVLHEAGIRNIYTTNTLLKNKDEFKIC